ncbi:MAG: HAD family hydrolase [bacterium]
MTLTKKFQNEIASILHNQNQVQRFKLRLLQNYLNGENVITVDFDETIAYTKPLVLAAIQQTIIRNVSKFLELNDSVISLLDKSIESAFEKNPGGSLKVKYDNVATETANSLESNPRFSQLAQIVREVAQFSTEQLTVEHEQSNLECIPKLVADGSIKVMEHTLQVLKDQREMGSKIIVCTNRARDSFLALLENLIYLPACSSYSDLLKDLYSNYITTNEVLITSDESPNAVLSLNFEGAQAPNGKAIMEFSSKKTSFYPELLLQIFPQVNFQAHLGDAVPGEDQDFADNLGVDCVKIEQLKNSEDFYKTVESLFITIENSRKSSNKHKKIGLIPVFRR